MQALLVIVAFFLFSPQIDALKSDSSMPKHFDDRRGLIFQQLEKTFKNEIPILEESPQDFSCQQCLDVSNKARMILTDTSLVGEVRMLSNEACLVMFSDLGEECLHITEKLITQAIPFLQIIFQKEDACNDIGFCPNNIESPSHSVLSPREPSLEMLQEAQKTLPKGITCRSSDGEFHFILDELLSELRETRICTACRVILSRVRIALKNPMTQAIIIKLLLKACTMTMTNRKYIHKCKRMVTTYGPLSVAFITRFMNVVDLCNLTHFCPVVTPKEREVYTRFT